MTSALLILLATAVLLYVMERSHRRRPDPHPDFSGSSNAVDRDTERIRAELMLAQRAPESRNSRVPPTRYVGRHAH